MNSNKINILEFPSNLGLKKKESEMEPGVKKLPGWLKEHGFHDRVKPVQVFTLEPPSYSTDLDEEAGVRNADKIIEYAKQQSKLVGSLLKKECFQLILGGDCSILIGNALALKQKGKYGLFFIDGHMDFIGPEISPTGGAAGMDLAIVTGHGHHKLTNIFDLKPYFEEKDVFCVGNREYDQEYVQPILQSQINYLDLENLRTNGLEKTALQFLNMITHNNLDGFFVHLDVDVLNDEIMPAVDSRQAGGLTYDELSQILVPILSSPKAIGIEITILDPTLDKEAAYTIGFVENFTEIIEKAKASTKQD